MEQRQIKGTRQYHSPRQYQLSSMIEKTDAELVQLMYQEAENNLALEIVTPDEADYQRSDDSSDYGDSDTQDGYTADNTDGSLTDEQRGDKVTLDNDDDEVVNTSSQQSQDEDRGADIFTRTASTTTLREDLKQQINELDIDDEQRYLAHYIIDSLDNDGYLKHSLTDLVDDLEFNQQHVTTEDDLEAVLVEVIQAELEPEGIGARNLRECLLLQLEARRATPATLLAYKIVDQLFDEFVANHYDVIEARLGIERHQDLVDAVRTIRHLNPKPGDLGASDSRDSAQNRQMQVTPDFFVRNDDGTLVITLNDSMMPQVRVSAEEREACEMLQKKVDACDTKTTNAAVMADNLEGLRMLRERLQAAQGFIDTVEERRITLLSVANVIVKMQRAYFLTGQIETLRPMTLQNVADASNYDVSTVSRVTSSRYADTEHGIIALRDLFTNAVGDSSQAAVVEALRQIIEGEDKRTPYVDEKLKDLMAQQGFAISRRTVSKYRDILGIPSASERKQVIIGN